MTLIRAIIMGIIQGITEFLPVSSTGHLAIFQSIFRINTETGLLFEVMLHLGTVFAIIITFKRDIIRLIRETIRMILELLDNTRYWWQNHKGNAALRYKKIVHNNYRKFVLMIICSTIPTAIIGYAARDVVDSAKRSLLVIGICLLVTGVLLLITDFSGEGEKGPKDVSYTNSFIIGICQGIAVLPGLSRLGATLVACLLGGFSRKFAVKYSFIISIPAILGAMMFEVTNIKLENLNNTLFGMYFVGMLVATFVGYFAIKVLMKIMHRKKMKIFAYYCFLVGFVAIVVNYMM
jgi:Uncharacterized bacitracin resistance protein